MDWLDWLFGRGRYPKADREAIIADAEHLLREFGINAYSAAKRLADADPPILEEGRSPMHWRHVRDALADHLDVQPGVTNYDRV